MILVPDMFEYEGPLDLTEYYVSQTELRAETRDLVRVKVNNLVKINLKRKILVILDCDKEKTIEPNSHDIPADNSDEYYRSHV